MNKRAVTTTLVNLVILVVVLLIMFGSFHVFTQQLEKSGEKGKCEWAVLFAAVQKAGSLGLAEGIPEGCKATRRTITMDDLRQKYKYAKQRITAFNEQPQYKDAQGRNKVQSFLTTDEDTLNEFALNNIVANELVDCWTKVFQGKMPLFDEWWRLYDCNGESCTKLEDFVRIAVPLYGLGTVVTGKTMFNRAPVNCVICAHIMFDNEIMKYFQGKNKQRIGTMVEWMLNNPVPRTGVSYFDFLKDGQFVPEGTSFDFEAEQRYGFDIDQQGIAVLYERINKQQIGQIAQAVIPWTKTDVDENYLKIVPYTQQAITQQEGCTFIID